MIPIQLRPLDVIVLFDHVEGVWEAMRTPLLESSSGLLWSTTIGKHKGAAKWQVEFQVK